MRWKTLGLLACLLIDAILVACGASSPRIPKGAEEALDRYYREFYVTEYSLVSAQQATQVVGIDEALRSQGVTPHGLSEVDEGWCVTTDPVVGHEISISPSSPAIWEADVILITRCGSRWWAGAVWDYFSHDKFVGSDGVAREVSAVLRALGCE